MKGKIQSRKGMETNVVANEIGDWSKIYTVGQLYRLYKRRQQLVNVMVNVRGGLL